MFEEFPFVYDAIDDFSLMEQDIFEIAPAMITDDSNVDGLSESFRNFNSVFMLFAFDKENMTKPLVQDDIKQTGNESEYSTVQPLFTDRQINKQFYEHDPGEYLLFWIAIWVALWIVLPSFSTQRRAQWKTEAQRRYDQ